MRCAALIVLAMVALVLSACSGRKAEPWTLPTYGKPAPRYTPIPPLGERESTGGRVFIVAVLNEAQDHASLDLWNSTEIQGALNSVGTNRLMGKYDGRSVPWNLPRPTMPSAVFAYKDGIEIDRDLAFTSSADMIDWIGRVRVAQIDASYADSRLKQSGGSGNALALQVHGLRMMRLGLLDRSMDSLMKAWESSDASKESPGAPLVLILRDLSRIHQPASHRLAAMATRASRSWKPEAFVGVRAPTTRDRSRPAPPEDAQWAMHRFAVLCLLSDRIDLLEARIAACQNGSRDSLERDWLLWYASTSTAAVGFFGHHADMSLATYAGRVDVDPLSQARHEILRPLAMLSLSDAPRESTLRQLEPELRGAGFMLGMKWCQCQAGGRRDEARDILLLLVEQLDYPSAIEGFLSAGITLGILPNLTDEWLARNDFNPTKREAFREGVELLRRQPPMPVSAE